MSVSSEFFGKTRDGRDVICYTISNKNGMSAVVMNYGANLKNLYVPGKKGKVDDVVIGYDKLWMYFKNGSNFGCTIGPVANRTANAQYKLNGKNIKMAVNDHEINNLHTDLENGFQRRIWDAETGKNYVDFSLAKKNGDLGPGNVKVRVRYTLTEKNELKLTYHAESDRDAVINMTNHSYFNLSGQKSMSMLDTKMTIFADQITEVDRNMIPTGKFIDVKGTPFDFTVAKKIGRDIEKTENDQLKKAHGYDHNYVIKGYNGKKRKIAFAEDAKSGRSMEVYSDLPGVQFYSGNWIAENNGKEGYRNCRRKGFCLETQYFPDAMNQEGFEKPVFGPEREYDTETVYRFYWTD